MRVQIALLTLYSLVGVVRAQGPDLDWSRAYSPFGQGQQTLYAIDTAAGNGFICAGLVADVGGYDFLALRLDSIGDTLWHRTFDVGSDDVFYTARQTSDGGFILGGRTNGGGTLDIYLVKLTSAGAIQWARLYAWNGTQRFEDILEVPGSGYVGVGTDGPNLLVFHVNTLGDSVWARNPIAAHAGSTIRAISGGYIIGGGLGSQILLLEVDNNGQYVWSNTYGAGFVTYPAGAVSSATGTGYYVAGYTYGCPTCEPNIYVLKTSNAGGIIWSHVYGHAAYEDLARGITATFDDGVVVAGSTAPGGIQNRAMFAMKLNSAGGYEWCRTYAPAIGHEATDVVQCADSGLAMAGYSSPDAVVVKTQPSGAGGGCSAVPGGEDCNSATPITSLPFYAIGTTTGTSDDIGGGCVWGFGGSPDVCYIYLPLQNEEITISLCGSNYDTELFVYENGVYNFAYGCNSDDCRDPQGNEYRSKIECLPIVAGNTYCITIDGYWGDTGDYELEITRCQPCILPCPPGSIAEGEPLCFQGYVDTYNPGCDPAFTGFISINCGDVICGQTGNYLDASGFVWQKDKDWYITGTTGDCELIWNVESETPVYISLADGICNPSGNPPTYPAVYEFTTGGRCSPAEVRTTVPAGIWWFSVEPLYDQGTPCGTPYVATLTCNCPAPLVRPANDDCGNCTAVTLSPGGLPVTYSDDNTNATRDCIYDDFREVWYCVTTTATMDVIIGHCGTTPRWRSATEWIWHNCPCTTMRTLMDFKRRSCADDNYETYFYDLPQGTYYFPVRNEDKMRGLYQITFEGNIFAPSTCNVIGQCPANLAYGHPNSLYWDGEWDPIANRICWSNHYTGGGVGTVQNILRWDPVSCVVDPPVVWSSTPSIGPCKLLAFDPRGGGQYWTGTIAWGANPAKLYLVNGAGTVLNSWTSIPGLPSMEWTGGAFDRDHNHLWVIVHEPSPDPLYPFSRAYELDVSNPASPVLIQGPHQITSPSAIRPMIDAGGADYVDADNLLIVIGNGNSLNDFLICYTDVQPSYSGPPPGPGLTVYDWCVPQSIGNEAHGVAVVDAPAGSPHRVSLTPYYTSGGSHPVYVYEACAAPSPFQLVISTQGGVSAIITWRSVISPHPLTETLYHVYRDTNPEFEPSVDNLIATTSDTSYVDLGVLNLPNLKFFYVVTSEEIDSDR